MEPEERQKDLPMDEKETSGGNGGQPVEVMETI
jgi:hypothetical protein